MVGKVIWVNLGAWVLLRRDQMKDWVNNVAEHVFLTMQRRLDQVDKVRRVV